MELLCNAELFAPEPRGRAHLLVAAGKIVWVGSEEPVPPASWPVTRTDLAGRLLCPGFIDCHVHLTGGGGEAGFASRVPPLSLGRFTRHGTTTVVGLLGTDDITRTTASLVAATRALAAEGLGAYCLTGGYHLPPVTLTGSVRDDIVFIDCILGAGEIALSDRRSSQPTLVDLLQLAGEAYVAGLIAGKSGIVHCHVGEGRRGLELIRNAIERSELPARIFHPTHVNRRRALFEEAMGLARRGCTIDVTTMPGQSGSDAWPASEALVSYLDAGLPPERITMSTDAGGSVPTFDGAGQVVGMGVGDPGALAGTVAALLRAGQPLERLLPAVTANPAAVLGLRGKGRLAAGCDADLVVLEADGTVRDVMIGGRWHLRHGQLEVRGSFETDAG